MPSLHLVIQLVAALYIAVLIGLTFFPSSPIDPSGGDPHVNLQPFATIRPALRLGLNSVPGRLVLGNIAAFVPVGLLLPLLTRRGNTWLLVLVVALALSIAIELGQLALSIVVGYAYRTADVDDVILNVTGAMLGYLAYAALTFPLRRKRTDRTAPKG